MLDWYFDCDGEQHSLRETLKQRPPAPDSAAKAAVPTQRKLERYTRATLDRPGETSCYKLFQTLLDTFREKIQKLAQKYCQDDSKGAEAFDNKFIWERSKEYALDTSEVPNVWLALSQLEDGFRKPVAVKKNDADDDVERLQRIMRKLRPGSFIASAQREILDFSEPTQAPTDQPARASTPRGQPQPPRWVSEAGVCTLEELFGRKLNPNDIIERNTKAHRMLVREILLSMALAVFHLHECKIAHNLIGLKYFKVFLIEEPPRSTNLRVKLVSMRRAETLSDTRERNDIIGLGNAMARVVLGDNSSIDELMSYDPSLYWLVTWILQNPNQDGAKLADVIRHPYFTSLNEKEVLTLALEGDIFGQIITTAEVRCAMHLPLPPQPPPTSYYPLICPHFIM
jgi:hypothetical protein